MRLPPQHLPVSVTWKPEREDPGVLQIELQPHRPPLESLQVALSFPADRVVNSVGLEGIAVPFVEACKGFAVLIENLSQDPTRCRIGIDDQLPTPESERPGGQRSLPPSGIEGDEPVQTQLRQPDSAVELGNSLGQFRIVIGSPSRVVDPDLIAPDQRSLNRPDEPPVEVARPLRGGAETLHDSPLDSSSCRLGCRSTGRNRGNARNRS